MLDLETLLVLPTRCGIIFLLTGTRLTEGTVIKAAALNSSASRLMKNPFSVLFSTHCSTNQRRFNGLRCTNGVRLTWRKVLWDCTRASCLNSTGETAAGSWSHESQQSTGCVIKEQMKKKVIHEAPSAPGVGTFSSSSRIVYSGLRPLRL